MEACHGALAEQLSPSGGRGMPLEGCQKHEKNDKWLSDVFTKLPFRM